VTVLEEIESALEKVQDPELHRPLTELGMIESVDFDAGSVEI
jgi:ATP-binding protein involved in chromosome partitioning